MCSHSAPCWEESGDCGPGCRDRSIEEAGGPDCHVRGRGERMPGRWGAASSPLPELSARGLAPPSVRGPSVCPTPTESSVSPLQAKSVWRPTPIRVPQTGPPSIALAQFVLPVTFGYLRAEAVSRSEGAIE
ncbi:hypothetical protein NDU88_003716 [Pleurodeles waltl]|uniref:Uncharacterized protein n=1 Tax=Pleurodeles waltl TaxID=8319 RepID=A0AAV7SGQ5_PLEWA|nr:hypothetical protein NDU88_003716 [Pleurodeles waltl]